VQAEIPERIRAGVDLYAAKVRGALGTRVRGLRLFGSWAQGTAGPGSDVDVWVLVDEFDDRSRRVPFDVAAEMLLDHGLDIAPTVMDQKEWDGLVARERRLARDISAQGISL
jgi:predicted nucleotidyltransferase